MTDIEGFLAIYGHSDNLLNNNFQYYAQRNRRTPNWKRLRAHFRGLFGRPEAKWELSKLWNMKQEKRTFQNWNENSDRGFFPQARQENLNFPRMS